VVQVINLGILGNLVQFRHCSLRGLRGSILGICIFPLRSLRLYGVFSIPKSAISIPKSKKGGRWFFRNLLLVTKFLFLTIPLECNIIYTN